MLEASERNFGKGIISVSSLMNKMRTERLGKMKILGDFDKSDCRGLVGIKATRELKVTK